MSDGCTSCGNKGGCDHRKQAMFAAVDQALARLYPTRRWGERDDEAGFRAGVGPDEAAALAETLASRLRALTVCRAGGDEDWCDFVYVLCVGRRPSVLELREGLVRPGDVEPGAEELYLRIALSHGARLAAVQEVRMTARPSGGGMVVSEAPRTGVFDAALLGRYKAVVTALAEADVLNVDFGDITQPPEGFDDGDYGARWNGRPTVANYLFFAPPAACVVTTVVAGAAPVLAPPADAASPALDP